MERLHKFLARCGVASRRKCEQLILARRVEVNQRLIDQLGFKMDPDKDDVRVDGVRVRPRLHSYVLFHKPKGILTTTFDPLGRASLGSIDFQTRERLFPVGRLDKDSAGLLLLTNDGELSNLMTHPSKEIPRTYLVNIEGIPTDEQIAKIERGVWLSEGKCASSKVVLKKIMKGENKSIAEITLYEGKKREVRRILAKFGLKVRRLVRIRFGSLTLGDLKPGKFRRLTQEELRRLKEEVGYETA